MNPLYWVLAASAVVWLGLFAYLIYVDRRVSVVEDLARQARELAARES